MRWIHTQKVKVVAVLLAGLISMTSSVSAQKVDTVDDIKAAFDSAMAQDFDLRIQQLERLEPQIEEGVFQGRFSDQTKTEALYYQYHARLQLANYPQVYQTYVDYLQSIKSLPPQVVAVSSEDESGSMVDTQDATSAFLRNLTVWKRNQDYTHCASICEVVAREFQDDPKISSMALYHRAWSFFRMNGTASECAALCNELIRDYPDSRWRAEGMRLLTNTYIAQGKHDDALGILELLKQQYQGTHWEQYADMRPGMIYELGKGDPQQALVSYQASLTRYPDHLYGPYINKQIKRLQGVIEKQLIQDALDGIARGESVDCDRKNSIVRIPESGEPVASKF